MAYYFLLVVLTFATFLSVVCTSAFCVHLSWPALAAPSERMLPGSRARALFMLRAFPAFAGALAAVLCSWSFVRYEPARTVEQPGLILIAAAVGTLCLGAIALIRTGQAWARSIACSRLAHHCERRTRDGASVCVVRTAYPLAAVTGVFRPRMIVSDALLSSCPDDEIDLIFAHEAAHVNRADNLARVLVLLLPDPLRLLSAGRRIENAWSAAVEEAADDDAAGGIPERRAALASALVRVAGLARTPPPTWMPELAFFQGDNLERRVRRLLAPGPVKARCLAPLEPCALAATALIVTWVAIQASAFHGLLEWALRILP